MNALDRNLNLNPNLNLNLTSLGLRPFDDSDLEQFKVWLKKEHVKKWFEHPDSWIHEIEHRKDEFDFVHHFILEADGQPVGFCQYYDYSRGGENWHNDTDITDTYSIDYMIGEEGFLRKGLATKMIALLEERIKRETKARKIIVRPEKENAVSRKTLFSAGYQYDNYIDFFIKEIKR